MYFRHLKPTGILAVNISNRYLDRAGDGTRRHIFRKEDAAVFAGPEADYYFAMFLPVSSWLIARVPSLNSSNPAASFPLTPASRSGLTISQICSVSLNKMGRQFSSIWRDLFGMVDYEHVNLPLF